MAKDFFDSEYEKQQEQQRQQQGEQRQSGLNEWYTSPAPQPVTPRRKPLYIVLLCIALVACIGFGWLLGAIVQSAIRSPSNEAGDILGTVAKYLENYYYTDITDEQWMQAIELSGTALMQSAGDQFSRFMSPQTYYDSVHPEVTPAANNKIFGVSFIFEDGIGLYVSSVEDDTPAYGKLKEGDIVLKLGNMLSSDGTPPVFSGRQYEQVSPGQLTQDVFTAILAQTDSATFYVLREDDSEESGYKTLALPIQRAARSVINPLYDFQFVEFYFNRTYTNVSTEVNKPQGVTVSTEQARHLDQLPAGTGYIRLKDFMYYTVGEDEVTAADEFAKVMGIFDELGLTHLILDIKGNPGGRVDVVSEIAAMLVTADALTSEADRNAVTQSDGKLLITYLEMPKPYSIRQNYYQQSSYSTYFTLQSGKCNIVVWTDGNSASASELLTGCLLDYGTAVQMGTRTYGKGIAQSVIELPFTGTVINTEGKSEECPWAFYYTCAKYYSPLGNNIHGTGYTPTDDYNGLTDYADLIQAAVSYWK